MACCLGDERWISEDVAWCIADALGFVPGPGGRFIEFDAERDRWTVVSVGRPSCAEDPAVGLAQGCGLVLDATDGAVVSEGQLVWSVGCDDPKDP